MDNKNEIVKFLFVEPIIEYSKNEEDEEDENENQQKSSTKQEI